MLDFLNSLSRKLISQPERVSTDTYSNIRPNFELEAPYCCASIGGIIASATYDPMQFRDPRQVKRLQNDPSLLRLGG